MKWLTLFLTAILGVLILALIRPKNDWVPISVALVLLLIHDTVWTVMEQNDRLHK